jgi:hypothetical protein
LHRTTSTSTTQPRHGLEVVSLGKHVKREHLVEFEPDLYQVLYVSGERDRIARADRNRFRTESSDHRDYVLRASSWRIEKDQIESLRSLREFGHCSHDVSCSERLRREVRVARPRPCGCDRSLVAFNGDAA